MWLRGHWGHFDRPPFEINSRLPLFDFAVRACLSNNLHPDLVHLASSKKKEGELAAESYIYTYLNAMLKI